MARSRRAGSVSAAIRRSSIVPRREGMVPDVTRRIECRSTSGISPKAYSVVTEYALGSSLAQILIGEPAATPDQVRGKLSPGSARWGAGETSGGAWAGVWTGYWS